MIFFVICRFSANFCTVPDPPEPCDIPFTIDHRKNHKLPRDWRGVITSYALAQVFLGDPEKVDQITSEGVHMPGGTDGSICLDLLCHNKLITEEEKLNPSEEL